MIHASELLESLVIPSRFPPVVFYTPKVIIFTSAFDTKLIQRLLTGTWWFGNVVYGPRLNPPK